MRILLRVLVLVLSVLGALLPAACGGGSGAPAGPGYPQTLTSIEPASGPTAGGTTVLLSGSGFLDPDHEILGLKVGDAAVEDWEVLDDTSIRLSTPPGAVGLATLWVYGQNSPLGDGILLAGSFRYEAPVVYVADGPAAALPQLHRIDVLTGASQLVGPIGYAVEALARAPDGVLWGIEGGGQGRLLRIDPDSAVGTPVGLLHVAGTGTPAAVLDVVFMGPNLLGRTPDDELVGIDLGTAAVTHLDTVPGGGSGAGIALGPLGTITLAPGSDAEPLVSWDPGLGSFSDRAFLSPPKVFEALALSQGVLYGLTQDPAGPALYRVDPASGAVSYVGSLSPGASAVAREP
jgi:hypothetical protein